MSASQEKQPLQFPKKKERNWMKTAVSVNANTRRATKRNTSATKKTINLAKEIAVSGADTLQMKKMITVEGVMTNRLIPMKNIADTDRGVQNVTGAQIDTIEGSGRAAVKNTTAMKDPKDMIIALTVTILLRKTLEAGDRMEIFPEILLDEQYHPDETWTVIITTRIVGVTPMTNEHTEILGIAVVPFRPIDTGPDLEAHRADIVAKKVLLVVGTTVLIAAPTLQSIQTSRTEEGTLSPGEMTQLPIAKLRLRNA